MKFAIAIIGILFLVAACDWQSEVNNQPSEVSSNPIEDNAVQLSKDSIFSFPFLENVFEVEVRLPNVKKVRGTILVLQGWNFPRTNWCDSTFLCDKALDLGYVLVMPEMGKSIYSLRTYPETREDWLKYPTRNWLSSVVIKTLHCEFNIFHPEHSNFIVGLSTGGRGALLLAKDHSNLFSGAASLSGDFDQTKFPSDNLYRGFWGSMKDQASRWNGLENPFTKIEELKVPVYIGHGGNDKVVSMRHFDMIQSKLKKTELYSSCVFHLAPEAEHDYKYWKSEVDSVLNFFKTLSK
tara:strand:+ start:41 stop:922 length:882 start_codon:yes stop_codon:yes gene_type:complete